MKYYNIIQHKFSLLIIALLSGIFVSCQSTSKEETNVNKRLNIVATTGMIADVVANIVKDSADVTALMGPGVDPHLYKATQGDLKKLRSADVIFYNGLHLEGKLGEIFKKLGNTKPVEAVGEAISPEQLINNSTMGGQFDPHIWFDVSLWRQVTEHISNSLQVHDSTNAEYYQKNSNAYISELEKLHQKVKSTIASIPESQRILITAHDAFGYFGLAYGIEVRGLQGISTLSEFGLKDVADLVNFIVENQIKAVFVESSVPEKYIESVVEGCQKKGHQVVVGGTLYSDAMGNEGTAEGTYIGMVTSNVETIANALK